uniref:Eukaryotic translation initiation factor 2-alpha kinase 2 n=1 Tax=Electrophorus electricus TaxID=8005 RepID=A0A4W4EC62_ELEEL
MEAGPGRYVALLNELAQKKCWTVEYQEVNTEGPDHSKTYTTRAVVKTNSGTRIFPDASGRNKREAKQNAAKNAFCCLEKEEPVNSARAYCSSDSFPKLTQPNYTCWLNEYAQKNKIFFKTKEKTVMNPDLNAQFSYACQYVCGDREFPEAVGKGKKETKEAAAKLVHEELFKEQKTVVSDENGNGVQNPNISCLGSTLRHLNLSSYESTKADQNFKGIINQFCQKANLVHDFKLVGKRGPAHDPEFVFTVVINKKVYPEGRGKTAKEAQQNAAQQACCQIIKESRSNSQNSNQSTSLEDNSSSQTSNTELDDDDFSSSKSISKNQNTSESIVFRHSSVEKQNVMSPVSELRPLDTRPKRKLAPNFQISPGRSKEEAPSMNAQNLAKPSTKANSAFNQSDKSRFLEEFDSITRIGKGGFGCVFKAERKLEKKYYAVKMVKYTEKARREVDALASLDHTNIVRYYTAWIEDTAYSDEASDSSSTSNSGSGSVPKFLYIQIEFCEGKTLSVWIEERNSQRKQNTKRRQEATQIMKQVLEAVKYVHSKKLIHRDLKPANIMFGHEGGVKVVDFGLVAAEDADNDGGLLERTNRTGTRSYMSPEQMNQSSYDRKVDIFALGLIYFELLWHLGTVNEKQKHKLIQKMLSCNPEERPDAIELFSQLEKNTIVDHNVQQENRTY